MRYKPSQQSRKPRECTPLFVALNQMQNPMFARLQAFDVGHVGNLTDIWLSDHPQLGSKRVRIASVLDGELVETVEQLTNELHVLKALIVTGSVAA